MTESAIPAAQLEAIAAQLSVKETDQTWEKMEAAIRTLMALFSDSSTAAAFVPFLKATKANLIGCLLTERTRLSGATCELMEAMARALRGHPSAPAAQDMFLPAVLKLTARTNKLFVQRAQAVLLAFAPSANPDTIVPKLCEAGRQKSTTVRQSAIEGIKALLASHPPERFESQLGPLETFLRSVAEDRTPTVRTVARSIIPEYIQMFPHRAKLFTDSLPAPVRKAMGGGLANGATSAAPSAKPQRPPFKPPKMVKTAESAINHPTRSLSTTTSSSSSTATSSSSTSATRNATLDRDFETIRSSSHTVSAPARSRVMASGLTGVAASAPLQTPIHPSVSNTPISTPFRPSLFTATPRPGVGGMASAAFQQQQQQSQPINLTPLIMDTASTQFMTRLKAFEKLAALLPTSKPPKKSSIQWSIIECHIKNGLHSSHPKPLVAAMNNLEKMIEADVVPTELYEALVARCIHVLMNPQNKVKPQVTEPGNSILERVAARGSDALPAFLAILSRDNVPVKDKVMVLALISKLLEAQPYLLDSYRVPALLEALLPVVSQFSCTEELRNLLIVVYRHDKHGLLEAADALKDSAATTRIRSLVQPQIDADEERLSRSLSSLDETLPNESASPKLRLVATPPNIEEQDQQIGLIKGKSPASNLLDPLQFQDDTPSRQDTLTMDVDASSPSKQPKTVSFKAPSTPTGPVSTETPQSAKFSEKVFKVPRLPPPRTPRVHATPSATRAPFAESPSLISTPLGIFGTPMPTPWRGYLPPSPSMPPLSVRKRLSSPSPSSKSPTRKRVRTHQDEDQATTDDDIVVEVVEQLVDLVAREWASGPEARVASVAAAMRKDPVAVINAALIDCEHDELLEMPGGPLDDLLLYIDAGGIDGEFHAEGRVDRILGQCVDAFQAEDPRMICNALLIMQQVLRNTGEDELPQARVEQLLRLTLDLQLPVMSIEQAVPLLTLVSEIQLTLALRDPRRAISLMLEAMRTCPVGALGLVQRLAQLDPVCVVDQHPLLDAIVVAVVDARGRVRDVATNLVVELLSSETTMGSLESRVHVLCASKAPEWGSLLASRLRRKGVVLDLTASSAPGSPISQSSTAADPTSPSPRVSSTATPAAAYDHVVSTSA